MHDLQAHFATQLATLNGIVHKKLYYAIDRYNGPQVNFVWSDKLETLQRELETTIYLGLSAEGFPQYATTREITVS